MSKENNTVKNAIKAYLDKRAAEDELFALSYAKPNKSIDECFQYIIGEVHKKGNAVYLSNEEVFGMAVHYYDEDDIKIEKLPNGVRAKATGALAPAVELTEEEKAQIKEQAAKKYEEKCMMEIKEKEAEKARKRREAKRAAQANEQTLFGQMLFDLDEVDTIETTNSSAR